MYSYLSIGEGGAIVRIDLRDEERELLDASQPIMGWWSSMVPSSEQTQAEVNRQQLRNTEGIFLSLYPAGENEAESPSNCMETSMKLPPEKLSLEADIQQTESVQINTDKDTLKYLLALMLERKRILKPVGRPKPGEPTLYRHPKLERTFTVPAVNISGEAVLRVQEQLQAIFG